MRFPKPTNCEHPQAARSQEQTGSPPRLVHCNDLAAADEGSTQLSSCDRKGKGYVLVFGK